MTITVNQDMLNRITDDTSDGWDGTITFSMNVDPGNVFQDMADFVGFNHDPDIVAMTQANMNAMVVVAELWDDLIARDINFVFNNDDEDIIVNSISNMPSFSAGYTYSTMHGILPNDADVFLKTTAIVAGMSSWRTAVHEFGHALGLMHPGEYNADDGNLTYANNAEFAEDTAQFSIMSYFDPSNLNPGATWSRAQILTPMVYDILAIQNYYGVDTTTRLGNTTYGFNSTANRAVYSFNAAAAPVLTIWDAGGARDRLDASGYSQDQKIDLTEGSYSDIGGLVANIGIAFKTFIEDAIGGSGRDRIDGNEFANRLDGGAGTSSDSLYGAEGSDTLLGNGGGDILYGEEGNDVLTGGPGSDLLNGGTGFDTAVYNAPAGEAITISSLGNPNLGRWSVTGAAQAVGDTLAQIEAFRFGTGHDTITMTNSPTATTVTLDGAAGNDRITGSVGVTDLDILIGGAGSDTIAPRQGKFEAYGGARTGDDGWIERAADNDTLVLDRSSYGAYYNFWHSTLSGSPLGLFTGFEEGSSARGFTRLNYTGSNFADDVQGGIGNDTMTGNGGEDNFIGYGGNDWLRGGEGNDVLSGDVGNDTIEGGGGSDQIYGFAGNDLIRTGGGGFEGALGGSGNDTIFGGNTMERLEGGDGNDVLSGLQGEDQLAGGNGNDTLDGGAGPDFLAGALGVDRIVYRDSNAGVTINLATQTASGGHATGDNLSGIEGVTGSAFADRLIGNGGANFIEGLGGNDRLTGAAGADRFAFSTKLGGGNVDTITDFRPVDDTIAIDNAVFKGLALGTLKAAAFVLGTATQADDRIIYQSANGRLLFDQDGAGGTGAIHFASVTAGLVLTAADFLVI